MGKESLVYRLRKRAEIRRQIPHRKSVQENKPDRIADLLEEAADEIEKLMNQNIPPPPEPPKLRTVCEMCGPIENGIDKGRVCRFFQWFDKLIKK